jgi:hypothetical protein
MTWQSRFDRLLKAMSQGEPHKAEKKAAQRGQVSEPPIRKDESHS